MVPKGVTASAKHTHTGTCLQHTTGKEADLSSLYVFEKSIKKKQQRGAAACFLLFHSVEIKVLRNTFRDPPQPPGL